MDSATKIDLKGHLLARKASLEQHGQEMTSRSIMLERELEHVRSEVAATRGAVNEIDRAIALVEGKEAAS